MGAVQEPEFGLFLTNIFGDRYLHAINGSRFNQVGSRQLYRQFFHKYLQKKNALLFFIGSDSGLLIKYLHEVGLPSGTRAVVLEYPEIMTHIAAELPALPADRRIQLVPMDAWETYLEEINFESYVFIDQVYTFESMGAAEGHLPEYKEALWSFKQQLETAIYRIKADLGSEHFIIRQLANLAENEHPSSVLNDAFPGRTAVLLGGGPSLDEALPWILEHRDELVIIAVSRISRRLIEFGLTPHLLFIVDPEDVSFHCSKEAYQFDRSVVLVNAYHANHKFVSQWQNRQLFMGDRLPWKSALNVDNYGVMGPTVTNSALYAALHMGFAQIILSGFDLCYSKEGFTHAQGSYEATDGPHINTLLPTVQTYAGHLANTTQAYLSALEDLQNQTKLAAEKNCRLVNSAAGAAVAAGIEHLPIDKIEISRVQQSTRDVFEKIFPQDRQGPRQAYLGNCLAEVRRVLERLKKINKLALEALDCNEGLFGRQGKKADFKFKVRMDKIEKTLNRDFNDLVPLIKQFALGLFLKTTRPEDDAEWTDEEIEEAGRLYYQIYAASTQQLMGLLLEAEQRILSRQEELLPEPNFPLLFQQWEKDETPGRAKLFLKNNSADIYVGETRKELTRLIGEFEYFSIIVFIKNREEHLDPSGVKSKAQILYRRQALEELQELHSGLAHFNDFASGQQLQWLIEGYMSELENTPAQAFASYNKLLDAESSELTEEALVRITNLALSCNDDDNALLAMECLSGLSPIYMPNYAEMLRLIGRHGDAAQCYTDYLTKVPEDTATLLKLAQLYMDMNANDSAAMALRFVLEHDPENSAAKILLQQLGVTDAQ